MEFEIAPSTPNITTRHLLLFRKYFLVLQLLDRFPRIMWLPLFTSHWFRIIRLPVLRVAVRVIASSHIKRVVQALDRAYQLRLAIDQPTPDEDDWKKLHEQAESMDGGLRPFLISKWVVVSLTFVIVFLVARSVPTGDFAITAKMVVAAVTLNPEKLAELAAEPGALRAFSRLIFGTLMLFIAFTPILIYHFRFKRTLFNSPVLLSTIELKDVAIVTIWKQQSTSPEGLYTLELDIFAALGQPALQEIPLDLLAIAVVFGYHAVGPGLVVGIIASQMYAVDRGAGRTLFYVAAINAAIGFSMVVWAMLQSASRQSTNANACNIQPPSS